MNITQVYEKLNVLHVAEVISPEVKTFLCEVTNA